MSYLEYQAWEQHVLRRLEHEARLHLPFDADAQRQGQAPGSPPPAAKDEDEDEDKQVEHYRKIAAEQAPRASQ